MHVAPHPENPDILYVGFQYGNYTRRDLESGENNRITPRNKLGEPRYRYNWNTPVNISHHNPEILYFGSQKLSRSFDEGKTWKAISPDLTHDLPNGDVPYSTLTSIAESPLNFNVIWIGTDDGNIQITKNGGVSWNLVSTSLPQKRWVSEVHASTYDEATAYVSLNGYRYDEFKTYLYKTTDFGETWTSLKGNLPEDVANVIVQDPVVPTILYAGLDRGSFVSFDGGGEWHYLNQLPNVASYDMIVHPRDLELVIATHGRSIWVMDVKPLHQLSERLDKAITAFSPDPIRVSERWGTQNVEYRDRIMPKVELMYFLNTNKENQSIEIEVFNSDNEMVTTFEITGKNGFNTFTWNLVISELDDTFEFLKKDTYILAFKSGKEKHEVEFEIK